MEFKSPEVFSKRKSLTEDEEGVKIGGEGGPFRQKKHTDLRSSLLHGRDQKNPGNLKTIKKGRRFEKRGREERPGKPKLIALKKKRGGRVKQDMP